MAGNYYYGATVTMGCWLSRPISPHHGRNWRKRQGNNHTAGTWRRCRRLGRHGERAALRLGRDPPTPRERRDRRRRGPSSDKANRASGYTVETGGHRKTLGSRRRLAFKIFRRATSRRGDAEGRRQQQLQHGSAVPYHGVLRVQTLFPRGHNLFIDYHSFRLIWQPTNQ